MVGLSFTLTGAVSQQTCLILPGGSVHIAAVGVDWIVKILSTVYVNVPLVFELRDRKLRTSTASSIFFAS